MSIEITCDDCGTKYTDARSDFLSGKVTSRCCRITFVDILRELALKKEIEEFHRDMMENDFLGSPLEDYFDALEDRLDKYLENEADWA